MCGLICEFSEPTNGAGMKLKKITVFHSRRNFIYYLNISTYVHIYGDLGRRGEGGGTAQLPRVFIIPCLELSLH